MIAQYVTRSKIPYDARHTASSTEIFDRKDRWNTIPCGTELEAEAFITNTPMGLGSSLQSRPVISGAHDHLFLVRFALKFRAHRKIPVCINYLSPGQTELQTLHRTAMIYHSASRSGPACSLVSPKVSDSWADSPLSLGRSTSSLSVGPVAFPTTRPGSLPLCGTLVISAMGPSSCLLHRTLVVAACHRSALFSLPWNLCRLS